MIMCCGSTDVFKCASIENSPTKKQAKFPILNKFVFVDIEGLRLDVECFFISAEEGLGGKCGRLAFRTIGLNERVARPLLLCLAWCGVPVAKNVMIWI